MTSGFAEQNTLMRVNLIQSCDRLCWPHGIALPDSASAGMHCLLHDRKQTAVHRDRRNLHRGGYGLPPLHHRKAQPGVTHRGQQNYSHHGKSPVSNASVVGASSERWNLLFRFATVRCTFPSSESAEGQTVAAFATHIGDAELALESQ